MVLLNGTRNVVQPTKLNGIVLSNENVTNTLISICVLSLNFSLSENYIVFDNFTFVCDENFIDFFLFLFWLNAQKTLDDEGKDLQSIAN